MSTTIKRAQALLTYSFLANIAMNDTTNAITPLVSGPHGIGKTAICNRLAKQFGGTCSVIEGGSIKEGEVTGIPFTELKDGRKTMSYVPHPTVASIQRLEQTYYNLAKSKDGVGGVKLLEDGRTSYTVSGKTEYIPAPTIEEISLRGEQNQYKFGENLPAEVKFNLIKSGAVKPVVLFIDEINRTEQQVMKEMMNMVLTRSISGYQFPWWVFVVSAMNPCSQDSVYATNEMDPAQLDRFLKICVNADIKEWISWAANDEDLSQDYLIALTSLPEDTFMKSGSGLNDSTDTMSPSPRSHTICAKLYNVKKSITNSGLLPNELEGEVDDIVEELIIGKIGDRDGRALIKALKNRDNFIDPEDLLSGKSESLDAKLATKIKGFKPIAKRFLASQVIKYLATDGVKPYVDILKKKCKDAKAEATAKALWTKRLAQLKEFYELLEPVNKEIFASDTVATKIQLGKTYKEYATDEVIAKTALFRCVASVLSKEVLASLKLTTDVLNSGDLDK